MKGWGRFEGYGKSDLKRDLIAGCIVGIIAIPLGMAFAIASGVKPETGIYTTIIAGILISLLGGSKFQIGGPTGAFIPILLAIVLQYGYDKLLVAGFLAGIILVLMGVLRLGALIKFIPKPVTVGFTAGIAVTIFAGQIGNFLGLSGLERHESFLLNMKELAVHIGTLNPYAVLIAAVCLASLLVVPRVLPKVPPSLVGLVLSTLVAVLLLGGKAATIGSAYGDIPAALPSFRLPDLSWDNITLMIRPALIIALLGGIESLLSAVVADGMSGSKHHSNRELIGQGIANMAAPLLGGIPATGAIARTATNIKNGAASPLSGIVHGLVVLLVLVLLAPYASAIPLAAMAPILMLVAWNMSERKSFARLLKLRNSDSIVLVVTFALTVFTTLTTAVEAGLALSVLLFVKRMAGEQRLDKVLPDREARHGKVSAGSVTPDRDCPQLGIFSVHGALFFGVTNPFDTPDFLASHDPAGTLLLRMGGVPFVDASGEASLQSLVKRVRAAGGTLLISGLRPQPRRMLEKSGLLASIGEDGCFEHTGEAIDAALSRHIDASRCAGCPMAAFRECAGLCKSAGAGAENAS
ncbi:SulP family inorganic anion transporter [Saccharibacillus sp. CPCC 101409]|uniref:SulP family inorganic anion transporter n=1 Tax=Saccharibacillus sp. CPCC 101409 TaxID=3058041 RepID=UPI00267123A0|nr:SulP family inorganic anion transporter [Saccharibacillus sp. CPCC 101409]MDO3411134.1 SulP family inorganic anion transporter [Saccharibacillus sp. CPCC 101409]